MVKSQDSYVVPSAWYSADTVEELMDQDGSFNGSLICNANIAIASTPVERHPKDISGFTPARHLFEPMLSDKWFDATVRHSGMFLAGIQWCRRLPTTLNAEV